MLVESPVFRPPPTNADSAVRLRVIGDTSNHQLLFLVNTRQTSSIELVNQNGHSTTVLALNKYLDFTSADVSPDHELIHVTQRIPNPRGGHTFLALIYSIHNPSICKEFKSDAPIEALFLEKFSPTVYQLLHFVGQRLTHLLLTISRQKIVVEKYKGGLHLPHVLFWRFDRISNLLATVYQSEQGFFFSEFRFTQHTSTKESEYQIQLPTGSKLPPALALSPTEPVHLPFFRSSQYHIFVGQYRSQICVIEQLYTDSSTFCSLAMSTYPDFFNRIIFVPGVKPDIPLCFLSFAAIVIVLAPNSFVCVIDLGSTPPSVHFFRSLFLRCPAGFAALLCRWRTISSILTLRKCSKFD
jgi:hypothetical protein